jgi:hypothetical protein
MHYDAMTAGLDWGRNEFEKQHRFLCDLLERKLVTNKNHYLRWEGDMEFYGWLEAHGVEVDQSKGPSKVGEAGFNFGTSHAYFPVHFDGKRSTVLEIPTLSQDLSVFAPAILGIALLEGAVRHHGIAHFLFHPSHFDKPATAPAMETIVAEGKKRGLEWWTAEQINSWERARRTVRWKKYTANGLQSSVEIGSDADLKEATILWSGGNGAVVSVDGKACATAKVTRWGFEFSAATTDLNRKTRHSVAIHKRGG